MLLVDLLILAGVGAVVVIGVGVIGGGPLQRRLEARRRRKQGERNAEEERRRLAERCCVCDQPIDAARDIWEESQWWHRSCWRQAVR